MKEAGRQEKCPMCKGKGTLTPPKRFGPRCLYEREKRGLSLREAGPLVGIGFNVMGRIERGELRQPRVNHALKLAAFYGLKLADFPDLVEP